MVDLAVVITSLKIKKMQSRYLNIEPYKKTSNLAV